MSKDLKLRSLLYNKIVNSCPSQCLENISLISVWKWNLYLALEHISKIARGVNSMRHHYWSPGVKEGSWKLSKHKLLPKGCPLAFCPKDILPVFTENSVPATLYIREKYWQNGKTVIAANSCVAHVFSSKRLNRWALYSWHRVSENIDSWISR